MGKKNTGICKRTLQSSAPAPEIFILLRLIAEQNTRSGYDPDGSVTFADAERVTCEYLRLSDTITMGGPPIGPAHAGRLAAFRAHVRRAAPLLSRLKRPS